MSRCPHSGEVQYRNVAAARKAEPDMDAYRCGRCRQYHTRPARRQRKHSRKRPGT